MALNKISTAKLRKELARRERGAMKLARSRDKLAKALAKLESELSDLGMSGAGTSRGGRRKLRGPGRKPAKAGRRARRAKNKLTLADALAAAVRSGAVTSPADAAKLVKARGYKTASKTFGIQVATTLANDKRFKRKGRGQYART